MYWLAVSLIADRRAVDALSDALLARGAISVDIADAAAGTAEEKPVFDEAGGAPVPEWTRGRVCALFPSNADIAETVPQACAVAGMPAHTAYEVNRVDDQDWVRATQTQFGPQRITSRLWVVPSWHTAPEPSAINILLDPGLAFGTGSHPTTRLCLRWLEQHIQGGEALIDFGCGSGILAIAALKLGAGTAIGVDIDPLAVAAARSNAVRNHVHARFFSAVDRLSGPADIVVANILANPLIVLAPLLARLTLPGGRIALSGILVEQAAEVGAAYEAEFALEHPVEEDGWILLTGTRH
jgi:ribosomal protein L11 methyltransferase